MICAEEYPALSITGPRQSGKTTIARSLFPKHRYTSFEQPIARERFKDDPISFLKQHANGAVFDEIQNVPELLSFLQQEIDERPDSGRFILTGSQNLTISKCVTQSLAGRTAVLELLPFSISELKRGNYLGASLDEVLWRGSYPPVYDRGLRPGRWYSNYLATYIERDVRQLAAVQDLDVFHRFMRLAASNVGQLINTSRLACDCGIDHKTIRRWLNILQAGYICHLLPPYYNNFRKRMIKTPKMFFHDSGLVCHLLGIENQQQLENHPLRGAIFENWVFSEIHKSLCNQGSSACIYFWRTHGGQEVDFIIEHNGEILGIEVKSGMTVKTSMTKALTNTLQQWQNTTTRPIVIYGGEENYSAGGIQYIPWHSMGNLIIT